MAPLRKDGGSRHYDPAVRLQCDCPTWSVWCPVTRSAEIPSMAKPAPSTPTPRGTIHLPKDALSRVALGHSFAEYDAILEKPDVFVTTPQIAQASQDGAGCFFVGRRGTGKTATTIYLRKRCKHVIELYPQVFNLQGLSISPDCCRDTRQRPFRSLDLTFQRALICEALRELARSHACPPSEWPPAIRGPSSNGTENRVSEPPAGVRAGAQVTRSLHQHSGSRPDRWGRAAGGARL
jgi:hypothetical protein